MQIAVEAHQKRVPPGVELLGVGYVGQVRQPPTDAASVAVVRECVGTERAARDRRHLDVRLHLEVEPVRRVLDGVLLRAVHRHQPRHAAVVRPIHRLVAGVDHRIQLRLHERPLRTVGDRHAAGAQDGLARLLVQRRALVVQPVPATVHDHERIVDRAAVPFLRRSELHHRTLDAPPRPVRGICPRHAHVAVVAARAPERAGEGLKIKVVLAVHRQDVARGRRTLPVLSRCGARHRDAALPPVEAVGAGRVPQVGQIPVHRRQVVGPVLDTHRLRLGLPPRVPHVEQVADLDHRRRVAPGHRVVAADSGDVRVAKAGKELVAGVLQRAPMVVQPVHRRRQRPVGRFFARGNRRERCHHTLLKQVAASVRTARRSSRCQLLTINALAARFP